LLEIANEHGFQIWKAAGTILSGAAQVGLGRAVDGLATLRGGMDIYQGLRSPPVFWPILLSIHAAACLHAGRPAEGLPLVEAALEIMSPGAGSTLLTEFQILKGDLLSALAAEQGREDSEAERWYGLALQRAHELGARIAELRAATRLCRVLQPGEAYDTARRTLADVYATFSEGFNTRDLIEARELLDARASAS
jgi:adenylate cyclase